MTRKIKAHELGDEHTGARIRTTSLGWTIEGELAEVQESVSDYYSCLWATGGIGATKVLKDTDVTILEEAPLRHPDEPTGLGAVVEADTGKAKPARWSCVVDSKGDIRWLRSETVFGGWDTWMEIQEDAVAPIRILSEGVHPSDDEPETPEEVA